MAFQASALCHFHGLLLSAFDVSDLLDKVCQRRLTSIAGHLS
jgi:hypothetical protein